MWNVPVAAGNTHPAFFMAFVLVWSFIGVTYLHFWWRVAPAALRIWAEGEGYGFISQKWAGVMDWISFAGGSGHIVYRVVVRDREGKEQHGLVRVGTPYWFCTSASRCPIKVRWGKFAGTLEGPKNLSDPTRFDWKGEGGGSARGRVATRRTVFCFAVADLILAIPLAALVLGALLVVGICTDEIWPGSLGLNRYLQRSPGPQTLTEKWQAMGMFLGYFVLYFPALVALLAGGGGRNAREKTLGLHLPPGRVGTHRRHVLRGVVRGRCVGVCPQARVQAVFSPRRRG